MYVKDNHLGNVLAVVSDRKIAVDLANDGTTDYFTGEVLSANDYYAFGSNMPGRSFTSSSYRYGFNGQEKDDEIAGAGNINTAEFWQYDTRLGRRWNIDPIDQIAISNYACFANNPILLSDAYGDSPGDPYKGGVQVYEAAEAKKDVPDADSQASGSFKVGGYDILPNYVTNDKKEKKFSHYTASTMVNEVKSTGGTEQVARIDYIFGAGDLQAFKDRVSVYEAAANMIFGADVHLTKGKIDLLNGEGNWTYLKEQYLSNPIGTATAFAGGFYGLMRGQYFKPNGGQDANDFIGHGSKKHMYNSSKTASRNSAQFGQNIDVKVLTEQTIKYGTMKQQIDASGNIYATKYSSNFGFNVGTKAMPTDAVRVFINHVKPASSTVFPYIKSANP